MQAVCIQSRKIICQEECDKKAEKAKKDAKKAVDTGVTSLSNSRKPTKDLHDERELQKVASSHRHSTAV